MRKLFSVVAAMSAAVLVTLNAQSPEPKPAFAGQTDAPRPAKPSPPFARRPSPVD